MKQIKKILVPVDFSEHSEEALQYARTLARRAGASIDVLHVYQIPTYFMLDRNSRVAQDVVSELDEIASMHMSEIEKKSRDSGVEIKTYILEGTAHQTITDFARRNDSDLIILGTHGRSGVSRALLGSVAERVIRSADTHTIAVPAGGAPKEPFCLLMAHDFSEAASRAGSAVLAMHALTRGPLHLAHVYQDVWAEYTDRGLSVGDAVEKRRQALRNGLKDMLETEAKSLFSLDAQVTQTHLLQGDAAEKLLELASEINADLICMGVSGKTGLERLLLGSVVKRVLENSQIPVLVAH